MKVDINKKYRTKSGLPVVIYAIYEGQEFGVHGAYQDENGEWHARTWQLDGFFFNAHNPGGLDLVEVRTARVVLNEDTVWREEGDE